jgi:hypothetical protein
MLRGHKVRCGTEQVVNLDLDMPKNLCVNVMKYYHPDGV